MIKISDPDLSGFTIEDYGLMFGRIDGVLQKRSALHQLYIRTSSDSSILEGSLEVPFEKFIVDLATGYLAGVPNYNIDALNDTAKEIQKRIFDKEPMDEKQIDEMKAIVEYITRYNDDAKQTFDLIHDLLEYGACYEVLYENDQNELIYTHFSALDTVAIWDTNIPSNLIAIVSKYTETNKDNETIDIFRVIDATGMRVYNRIKEEVVEDKPLAEEKTWDDVPGFAVETDFSIIENCETLISTYQSLLSNIKETYKYNAEDCKMKISGYKAQNRLMIKDESSGEMKINPDREKEDQYILNSKTFYTEEGGDAAWLIKPVDAGGATELLKYYVDSIFQLCGIPNTSDLAFNSADLNASAIDRKFYVMNIKTEDIISNLKKGLLRRFELIFDRLNFKFDTNYDFRYIIIDIPKNLPSMKDETIDRMMKLNGILSEETVIEELGYDYESEKLKKESEVDDLQLPGQEVSGDEESIEEKPEEDNGGTRGIEIESDTNIKEEERS